MFTAISLFFTGVLPALLKSAIAVLTPVLTAVAEFAVWYIKTFWKGLGVIFSNLSVLTVLLVVFGLGGWMLKSWDNDKVLKECIKTCPTPKNPEKYYHPAKRAFYKKFVPSKLQTGKVKQDVKPRFNPFQGQ